MRSFSLVLVALFFVVAGASAQVKPVEKAVIKTPTIGCDVCKERVEFFIGHEDGVNSVVVNIRNKTTTVTYLTDRTTLPNIKTAIANLGFDADDIEADEYAFKRLPKTCQAHKPAAKPQTPNKE